MAKKRSKKKAAKKDKQQRSAKKQLRALEHHLAALEREHRKLTKRVKKLARAEHFRPPFPGSFPGPRGGPRGGPPWRKQFGPVVSLEVPLETNDPTAPLWATVAARLPEEITTVGDDGTISTYRYSAVGSTPQAPRYRELQDPRNLFRPERHRSRSDLR